jgi:hypothetical protein
MAILMFRRLNGIVGRGVDSNPVTHTDAYFMRSYLKKGGL